MRRKMRKMIIMQMKFDFDVSVLRWNLYNMPQLPVAG